MIAIKGRPLVRFPLSIPSRLCKKGAVYGTAILQEEKQQ